MTKTALDNVGTTLTLPNFKNEQRSQLSTKYSTLTIKMGFSLHLA